MVTTEEDINKLNYPIRDNYLVAVLAAVFAEWAEGGRCGFVPRDLRGN